MKYKILRNYGSEGMSFDEREFDTVDAAVKCAIAATYSAPFLIVSVIDWAATHPADHKGRSFSTKEEKAAWIKQHPELWDKPMSVIKSEMVKTGLCSKNTYIYDIGIRRLIEDLKKDATNNA